MSFPRQRIPRNMESSKAAQPQSRDNRPVASNGPHSTTVPPRRTWKWFLLAVVLNYLLFRFLIPSASTPVAVPYTLFKEEVHKDNVKAIYSQGETITGKFSAPVTFPQAPPASEPSAASSGEPRKITNFKTILPAFVDPGLEAFLIEHKVEISAEPIQEGSRSLATLIFGFAPALLLIGFYVWMFRRAGQGGGMGGLMGIGRSKARRYDQEKGTKVSFDDVAGIDE